MKKVVLSGYYGFNNIGDEAVLIAIVQALKKEIPDVEITVLSYDPPRTEKQLKVKAVNRWRLSQIIGAIKECDLFISGGGSLLQDVTGKKSILYYLGIITIALWWKKPTMIYAQGIGPVQSSWARKLVGQVLNKMDLISVRDEASRADLSAMGVTRPPMYVTVDPVMGLERGEDIPIMNKIPLLNEDDRRMVGISLRQWPGLDLKECAKFADYLAEQGFKVVFLPFHFPEDISVCRDAAKLMQQENYLIKDNLTPMEMMHVVGKMDLVVGMRLHALIMSGAQGVPFLAIEYDPKVGRYANLMGTEPACSVEAMSHKILLKKAEQILADYSLIRESLLQKARWCRLEAQKPAQWAAEIVNRSNSKKGSKV
ncbi:MAG: polysaccharide pyruvyl transferase CsaB [Dehalobacterium sp.]|jgi:polysaccharide pyruvyl transferase CsaB